MLKKVVKCQLCKWYDRDEEAWNYKMAFITDWRPPKGLDPKMREFKCSGCGQLFYVILTRKQVEV